jgi:hypothetical protein
MAMVAVNLGGLPNSSQKTAPAPSGLLNGSLEAYLGLTLPRG